MTIHYMFSLLPTEITHGRLEMIPKELALNLHKTMQHKYVKVKITHRTQKENNEQTLRQQIIRSQGKDPKECSRNPSQASYHYIALPNQLDCVVKCPRMSVVGSMYTTGVCKVDS